MSVARAIRLSMVLSSSALLAVLGACEVEPEPATQVVVVVGSDLPLGAIEVSVASENARIVSSVRRFPLEPRAGTGRALPTSFTIVPARVEPAQTFRVAVTGFLVAGSVSTPVVRAIATGPFESGRTTMLPLALSHACRAASDSDRDACGCSWERDSCAETSCRT